ncbi:hypothetical protein [Ethanoligenens sp.]|uniref:hypothetical protein n=1 Tax=Ethanoligenens sp. TaxID=2099655 RepID=UPI0039E9E478
MKIARVFPRRTAASPNDDLAFFGPPPILTLPEVDEVHISVAFTYDMRRAEELAYQWEQVGVPVKMGGPAFNEPGGGFVPGMYLKRGYVITSRGCPNRCWFCNVPKREGYHLRELPITNGWNVLDDNLLACSDQHIRAVFDMLKQQPKHPEFTGGLEAKILKPWHCDLLREARTKRMYFAYDTPDDLEPLVDAGRMLQDAGFKFSTHTMCCYVLIGYPGDTFEHAEKRLTETIQAGFMPYAMLYRDKHGQVGAEWRKFQRVWCRPQIVAAKLK